MQIQLAVCKDVKDLYRINQQYFPIYEPRQWIEFLISEDIKAFKILKADIIVGYILGQIYSGKRYHIISFVIDKDHRYNGYGDSLFKYVKSYMKNDGMLSITINLDQRDVVAVMYAMKLQLLHMKNIKNLFGLGLDGGVYIYIL